MRLGFPHPDYLTPYLTSSHVSEWIAYHRIQPFGEARADWRMGQIAALIANVNRDESRFPRPFTPEDFIPRPITPTSELDQDAIAEKVKRVLRR